MDVFTLALTSAVLLLAGEVGAQCKPPFTLVPDLDNDGNTPVALCMLCRGADADKVAHSVAEQECRNLNATLTSTHSSLQQSTVEQCGDDSWIGLFADINDANALSWHDSSPTDDFPPPGGNVVVDLNVLSPERGACMFMNEGVGKWDDRGCNSKRTFVCSQVVAMCPVLEAPENALPLLPPPSALPLQYSNAQYQDSVATYQCKAGYALVGGDATRTCLMTGEWSGGAPACQILNCGAPPEAANSEVEFGLTTFEAEAEYSCRAGYVLNGDPTVTCSDVAGTPTWKDVPTCAESGIQCGKPGVPDNGHVTAPTFKVNQEITYGCDVGFVLSGSASATCLANGQWSPAAPTCESLDDDDDDDDEDNDDRKLIIGLAVGGVAFLALLITAILLCLRARAPLPHAHPAPFMPAPQPYPPAPRPYLPAPQPYPPPPQIHGYGPTYPKRYPAVGYY